MTVHRVVIFGSRELGLAVARQLSKTASEFLLIDKVEHLQQAENEGFPVSSIDYTRDSELASVGIGYGVNLVFCLLADDAQNVFLTIAVRALAPQTTIVAAARASDTLMKLRAAGANQVIDPQDIVGGSIARLIRQPLVAEVLQMSLLREPGSLYFQEWLVSEDDALVGRRLNDLGEALPAAFLVLGVSDGTRFSLRPDYQEPLRVGQIVLTIGPGSANRDPQDTQEGKS